MSELGSRGVVMEVTQPAWPSSVPRRDRLSAMLIDYSKLTCLLPIGGLAHRRLAAFLALEQRQNRQRGIGTSMRATKNLE